MNDDSIKSFRTYEHFFCLEENLPLHETAQVFLAGPFCTAEKYQEEEFADGVETFQFFGNPPLQTSMQTGKNERTPCGNQVKSDKNAKRDGEVQFGSRVLCHKAIGCSLLDIA